MNPKSNKVLVQANNVVYKLLLVSAAYYLLTGCISSQNDLPSISVDFARTKVTVLSKEYFIDSIAMIDDSYGNPIFALKVRETSNNAQQHEVILSSPGGYFKQYGTLDSACNKNDLQIEIFIKSAMKDREDRYAGIYYHCNSDSVVVTKVEGDM
jgi:hypothetical protein